MKSLKFLPILFSIFLLVSFSAANHKDREITTVIEKSSGEEVLTEDLSEFVIDYGRDSPQPFRVAILCDGADCPYGPADSSTLKDPLYLNLCGEKLVANDNYNSMDTDFWTNKQRVPTAGILVNELKCTPGVKNPEIIDQEDHTVKEFGIDFAVDYRTSGPQLAASINIENSVTDGYGYKLDTFRIENTGDGKSPGNVRIAQSGLCIRDCGDFEPASTNTIISWSNTGTGYVNNIDDFIAKTYGDCGNGATLCRVANKEFSEMTSRCDGKCPIGHVNQGSNADYIPRGEVIAGQEFSTDDRWPETGVDNPYFHVCDSSLEGYKGMEGKTVYSPGDNFEADYFQCRDYEWIQREQCQPGYVWKRRNGNWQCFEKEPKRINVDFLDIQKLPQSKIEDGYKAGFRIASAEADKFEDQYDAQLQKVNAECWMGEDDQRPADVGDKGVVTVDVDEFRTGTNIESIWALMEVPYREGIDNKTYSCVYGFQGYGQHGQYIYQGVNDYLLESMDEEALDYYEYSNIQSIYQINKQAYSNTLDWENFAEFDERAYTDFGGPSPFNTPNKEYPYCPPDNPLYPDPDIQC